MLLIIEGAKLTSMTKDTCDVIGALQIHSVGDGEGGGGADANDFWISKRLH